MSKRKVKGFSFQNFDVNQYKQTEAYVQTIEKLFNNAILEFSKLAGRTNFNPDKPFSFADYPDTSHKAQSILNDLAANMQAVVNKGSRQAWLYACKKNDEFINSIVNTSKLKKSALNKLQDRNLDALDRFQSRKVDGMNLSQRVWKYSNQFKEQIEYCLDVGLSEGRSAQELSKDVRQNLNQPERLFRRVRDKRGVLRLSKAAAAYHPGQGVYRSATKNALRLTRTEINLNYREADRLRWEKMDFVIGFEVRRSNRGGKCKLCERLKGRYPKTFVFKGWHPQCRCFVLPILQEPDEFDNEELEELKAAFKGTEYKKHVSRHEVTDVPEEFKKWCDENREASKNWRSVPYFVKDNFTNGNLSGELKLVKPVISLPKPTEEDVESVSPNMPEELTLTGAYVAGTGIKFKKEFFDLINPEKPIAFRFSKEIKGSYYEPFKHRVNIADSERIAKSKWQRECIVYHEFGHAIDFQSGLKKHVKPLMRKYKQLLSEEEVDNVFIKEYNYITEKYDYVKHVTKAPKIAFIDYRLKQLYIKVNSMKDETFVKRGISKSDVLEQIGSALDTVMSINPKFGLGHSKAYFKKAEYRETEFIAHAFENTYATNRVFQKYMPDLYEDMIDFIKGLKK